MENAHPFVYGEKDKAVILSHNGVVDAPNTYDVDSMYAADLLSKAEPGDYQKALGNLAGWYALTWLDQRNGCLYFLNWQSHMAFMNFRHTVYYSSDPDHLEIALGWKGHCHKTNDNGEVHCYDGHRFKQLKKFTGKKRFVYSTVNDTDYVTSMGGSRRNSNYQFNPNKLTGALQKFKDGRWFACTAGGRKFFPVKDSAKYDARFPHTRMWESRWLTGGEVPDVDWTGKPVNFQGDIWTEPEKANDDTKLEDSEQGIIHEPVTDATQQAALDALIANTDQGDGKPAHSLVKEDVAKRVAEAEARERQETIERLKASTEALQRETSDLVRMRVARESEDALNIERQRLLMGGWSEDAAEDDLYRRGFYDYLYSGDDLDLVRSSRRRRTGIMA